MGGGGAVWWSESVHGGPVAGICTVVGSSGPMYGGICTIGGTLYGGICTVLGAFIVGSV